MRKSWHVVQELVFAPVSVTAIFKRRAHVRTTAALLSSAFLLGISLAQGPPENQPKGQQNGMSTGAAHAAVKDAQSRPITAGGFVDGAPVIFTDITHTAGLDRFHHRSGTTQKGTTFETPGSGVAVVDYDQDGWLDIYLVNGSTFSALKGSEPSPKAMLLHNNHDGIFTDITDKAGVANERWGFGVAVGDYDNDGCQWNDIRRSSASQWKWAGGGCACARCGFGDLFNDGHIDVVMNVIDSTPVLLRNVVKNTNHWLEVKLVGGPKSPRDAIGAKAYLTAGSVRQRGDAFSRGSCASSSDLRLHFGLGAASKVDKLEIQRSNGSKEVIQVPAIDRIVTVVEGKGIVEP